MSTIITRNSATSGSIPSSLVQGELAINVTDGRLFYGSGSGNAVKEFSSGTNINTGSFATTGSNVFRGNQTITGSLNITGSTTQIGNNTLLGNTTLSGSITISGSTVSPTIQIYGNTTHNGYIRFDPVNTNINTSISASYIYVSGSTNDLYFSQNGSGYNNVTRLRWLEGNLYTGLLNGGLITTQSSTVYQVSSGSGVIVTLNASYNNNPYPTIQYINWPNLSASISPLSASFDQTFVAINSSGSINVQGVPYTDGQYNTLIPIGVVVHQNHSTINAAQTFPGVAYGWKQRSYDFVRAFGPLKISGYALSPSGSSTGSLVLSGGTAWVDGRNYTIDPNNPSYIVEATGITTSKIYRYYQSGSGTNNWVYDTNGGAGYPTIDPTQYSNSGSLTPVPGTGVNKKWTIQRVYYFPNSATKALYVYYGNAYYDSQTAAIAAIQTEDFTEAPNTNANAIFIGCLILRKDASFTDSTSYTIQSAGLFRSAGSGGGGGGSTSPGGTTTQIQYNNAGGFGGVPTLTWDGTTLSATGSFSGSFTGILTGTSSYASQALSSSYAVTASFVTGSIFTNSNSAASASYAQTASYVLNAVSSSYSQTASYVNPLNQNVQLTGSMFITGSQVTIRTTGNVDAVTITGSTGAYGNSIVTIDALNQANQNGLTINNIGPGDHGLTLNRAGGAGSVQINKFDATPTIYATNKNLKFWTNNNAYDASGISFLFTDINKTSTNQKTLLIQSSTNTFKSGSHFEVQKSGSVPILYLAGDVQSGSFSPNELYISGSLRVNSGNSIISGSLTVTNGITGSLQGTSSWASNAVTASFVTGSIFTNSNSAASASYAVTASYVKNAQTASYVLNAVSSSYALTASYAMNGGGGAAFPYTGSALITGSLGVTGSISNTSTINGLLISTGNGNVSSNVSIGATKAFNPANTGTYNTAIGKNALSNNTTGKYNTAIGRYALRYNTTGFSNTAIGNSALTNNTTGNYNTAIGYRTLLHNTAGGYNTAIGNGALGSNTTGGSNTAIGYSALKYNTTGNHNTAIGRQALNQNTTGIYNTAIGYYSLRLNTTGNYNTAIGHYALQNNTTGKSNTAIGEGALNNNITGLYNTAIGFSALANNTTGNDNISLGRNTSNAENYSYSVAIGKDTVIQRSNYFHIGSPGTNIGTVQATGDPVAKFWPVYINGNYERIALL